MIEVADNAAVRVRWLDKVDSFSGAGDQRTYAVALVRDDEERERRDPGRGRGLVWLVGIDGSDTTRGGA